METKALKKQMGAAIAMVLVAAIALAASTYAWFVTNNKVEATTSTISAQSNAAYMTIEKGMSGAHAVDQSSVATDVTSKPLYPATFGEQDGSTKGKFMTGFGTALDNAALKGSLSFVKDANTTAGDEGAISEAVKLDYALQQDFNISSKGQNLTNIQVTGVAANADSGFDYASDASLKSALRVLITDANGTNWVVYGLNNDGTAFEKKLGSATADNTETFGDVTAGDDTIVHVYLYYEGSDTNVNSKNLQNGKLNGTQTVTVTFEATAQNK